MEHLKLQNNEGSMKLLSESRWLGIVHLWLFIVEAWCND